MCRCVHVNVFVQNVTELQSYTFPVVFIAIYSFLLADSFLSLYEARAAFAVFVKFHVTLRSLLPT